MSALAASARACVVEITSAAVATRAYSGLADADQNTLRGYVTGLEALAALSNDDMLAACQTAGPQCDYARAAAARHRRAFASARGLVDAYVAIGSATLPANTLNADETRFERADTPSGVDDIRIGMRSGETRDYAAELPLHSICAFVIHGVMTGENCATSAPGLASMPEESCTNACAARAVQAALSFRRFVALGWLYRGTVTDTAIAQENAEDRLNNAKWNAYWFGGGGGRTQWPWEMLVNGARYEPREDDDGRFEPPRDAWILLHPGLGATFYESAGDQVELAAVFELLGYSRWSYDLKTGVRKGEWGASVIAAYAQSDVADDWGYGVLVRTPYRGLNISWLRRDGPSGDEDALMLSINLNDLAGSFLNANNLCGLFGVSVGGLCSVE